jgi:ribonuclease J
MSHPHPELGPPPALASHGLRIVALGGLGEIGRNMTVFEYGGKLLIVDCGVLFPDPDQPGVDLILPDFTAIRNRVDDVVGVVLTHGHEDHIGGLPYLLRERPDIPLIGSRLTLALIKAKLVEHRLRPEYLEVREGGGESIGPFDCRFFAVNHSIPDGLAVAITTGAGTVLHTGDFKMDQLPLDGRLTDLPGVAALGAQGIDLLLADSTNAEVPGFVAHERDIKPVLKQVFAAAEKRIIVASFASHVHRIQQVLDVAADAGRQAAFVGRSMIRNMTVARELGYLKVPDGLLTDAKGLDALPGDRTVLICTGSQGEPMAALSRMAGRDHPIRIEPGDTVVLASSMIPGNETAINRVVNGLTRWGATVIHKGNARVHVSGHASAGELLYFYNLARPRNFMPVHGELRHLHANAALAVQTGVDPDCVVIAEDGVVVDLVDGAAKIVGKVPCSYVYVDGLSVGAVTEFSLKDRRILGEEGFLSVFLVVDANTGKAAADPEIHARGAGIPDPELAALEPVIEEVLAAAAADGIGEAGQLQQLLRRRLTRWVADRFRRRPMVLVRVIDI